MTLCSAQRPGSPYPCELEAGHRCYHRDCLGVAWPRNIAVCGAVHPRDHRLVCERPEGHAGGHATPRWWWSR